MPLTRKDKDRLMTIHAQAQDISRHVMNMLLHDKVGRDWKLDMRRAADRIVDQSTWLGVGDAD